MTKNQSNFLIRHASLRQIQVFESVARNLSFTRAAEELHLTQPTVSSQVKSLVEAIEMPLYEQVGRNIYLTEVGEHVACSCREVIDRLSNLEILLDDFRGLMRGRLRVAVVSTAKYFAPLALGNFIKQHPDIDLNLKVSNRENILNRINHNMDDLYILGQIPPNHLDLEIIPFAPNPLVVIANGNHELCNSTKKVTLKKLAKYPFIMREEGSGIRSAVQDLFDKQGLEIQERMTLETNEAIKHCVSADLGIAVVSRHSLYLGGDFGSVKEIDVEGFPIEKEWHIVYPKGKELSLIARSFLDFLQEKGTEFINIHGHESQKVK